MHRLRVYVQREGMTKTLIYGVVLVAVLHEYTKMWPIPGERSYVVSVLALGLGLGTAVAQIMYRDIERSTVLLWITGISLWIFFVIVYQFQVPLPHAAHWGLNILFWMQVTAVFLVVSSG